MIVYREFKIKVKNKDTDEIIEIHKEIPFEDDDKVIYEESFEIVDFKVVYG